MAVAASQAIIPTGMVCVMMKTLETCLKQKAGQTVQSLDIISQDSIVLMVIGLKTLTNFDVVKCLKVKRDHYSQQGITNLTVISP